MNYTIYKLTAPGGEVYIGKTKNFKRRMLAYKYNNCKDQKLLLSYLIEYGFESFSVEVLKVVGNNSDACELEAHFVSFYNTYSNGLNSTMGGDGFTSFHSDDTKERIRVAKKGTHVHTEETKQRLSVSMKGNNYSVGIKCSEE